MSFEINFQAWHSRFIDLSHEAEALLFRLLATQAVFGPMPVDADSCHRRLGKVFSPEAWRELISTLRVQPNGNDIDWFAHVPPGIIRRLRS